MLLEQDVFFSININNTHLQTLDDIKGIKMKEINELKYI